MAISVDPMAFVDVRFDALAKALRCGRDSALVRMMRVWHMCTELETDRLSSALLGPALRCKPDRVAGILEAVELGELVDEQLVRIRGTNEKRTGWKSTQRERAEASGTARARDLEAEILASLAECPASSRNEVVGRLRARRANVYKAFSRLWDSGTIVRDGSGMVVPAEPGNSSRNNLEQFPEQPVPQPPTPTPTPRNTLAGVPAPAQEQFPEQVTGRDQEQGNTGDEPPSIQPTTTVDRYTRLYEHWRRVVTHERAKVRDPGHIAGRVAVHGALAAPELAGVTDAEVEHGLSMLGVQASALAQEGEQDPWWLLSSAWSPKVLRAAIDVPDTKTARARALRRNKSGNKGRQRHSTLPSKFEGDST